MYVIIKAVGVSLFVTRVTFESRVKFESRVRFESGSNFFFFSVLFFSFFFPDYTNDVRTVTRNINFPVGDIFDRKRNLPLCIVVASPRCTTIHFLRILRPQICAYLKNMPQTVKGVEARNNI